MDSRLLGWIKENTERGYSKQEMEKLLLDAGYSKTEIDEAFNYVPPTPSAPQAKDIERPGILRKIKLALFHPSRLFESVGSEGIKQAFVYNLAVYLIFGVLVYLIVTSLLGFNFLGPYSSPMTIAYTIGGGLLGLASVFVTAFFVHIGIKILKGRGNYAATYKATVYAFTPSYVFTFLMIIPFYFFISTQPSLLAPATTFDPSIVFSILTAVGVVTSIAAVLLVWCLIIGIKGLSRLHKISGGRAFAAIIIGVVILIVIMLIIVFSFAMLLFSALPIYGGGGNLTQMFGFDLNATNPEVCNALAQEKKDTCFTVVAFNTKDPSVCERITDSEIKRSCHSLLS